MQDKPILIHTHFHHQRTGVTRSIENVFPFLEVKYDAFVFGYNVKAPKISLKKILRLVFSKKYFIIHCHRNNEIIRALFLKLLGANVKLISTRHAETEPSGFTTFLHKKTDVVITLTESMANKLPFPTSVVGHGVDTTLFKPNSGKEIAVFKQKNMIACAGRVREAKGQKVLVAAIAPLLKKFPNWSLAIVGKVDKPSYFEELKLIAEDNNVVDQIYFWEETPEIIPIYQASHTVVVPSFSEGFSLVCAEAMACGCNVVATKNVGVHSALVKLKQTGYLFEPGNIKQLQQMLFELMKGELPHLGTNGRQSILDEWSSEKEAKKLMEIYEQK